MGLQLEDVRDFCSLEQNVRRLLAWISFVVLLVMIILHFGLVEVGQWTNDEFGIIGSYRENPWTAFCDRLMHWSPRPISEVLIWIYACLVNSTHKPFIGLFLGLLWLMLLSTPLIAFLQVRKCSGNSPKTFLYFSLFAYELMALFLLEHSPGELFYWPVGASAYLTTLSAVVLCFFQLACNLTEDRRGRIVTTLSLILAAGSSETGAFFALVFGCLSLIGTSVDRLGGGVYQRKIVWYLIPALFGIAVFGLLLHTRARAQEALFPTAEYHNLSLSATAAIGQTLQEYLVPGHRLSARGIVFGLILKACFIFAVRYCWLSTGTKLPRRQVLILFALSVIATTYFSVTASYYGYGGLTNPWHEELRQCLVMLVIASGGLFSCHYRPRILNQRKVEWLGGVFVLTTLVLLVPRRYTSLVHDYRNYSACLESRNKSWRSGLSEGKAMIWFSPPRGEVAQTLIFLPGTYDSESKNTDYAHLMRFFNKGVVEIRPYLAK